MKYFTAIILVVAVAPTVGLLTTGCERRAEHPAEYPFAIVAAMPPLSDAADWEYVEALGAKAGPFKPVGDHVENAGAGKSVSYTFGRARFKKDLDIEEPVLLRRFVNRQGDPLVLVYKLRSTAAASTTASDWI
jgi:hypothetical protein